MLRVKRDLGDRIVRLVSWTKAVGGEGVPVRYASGDVEEEL